MRVKNEARWIERVIRSVVPVCGRVIVLDDHSTDRTAEIAYGAGAMVFPNPFDGLNETRDKNYLLTLAQTHAQPGEWALMIDGDEELHPNDADLLVSECSGGAAALSMRVLYLWDTPRQVRMDGVYARFRRPSAFRMTPGLQFRTTPNGGNFHCGNVPAHYVHQAKLTDIRLLHYGYLDRADRLRKYDWYNAQDPGNAGEDCYRHMVVGDLFPADSTFRYGGPLRLEAL
jgi:glycosyltransferase involved in cell wall biosynthesis